mmetsp:Transcript_67247/g.105870  ORF Transcript_67247/g.105870 Transcript_67247/m.105870 type:complete len:220 (-) Transcript_67247:599-1258(-)
MRLSMARLSLKMGFPVQTSLSSSKPVDDMTILRVSGCCCASLKVANYALMVRKTQMKMSVLLRSKQTQSIKLRSTDWPGRSSSIGTKHASVPRIGESSSKEHSVLSVIRTTAVAQVVKHGCCTSLFYHGSFGWLAFPQLTFSVVGCASSCHWRTLVSLPLQLAISLNCLGVFSASRRKSLLSHLSPLAHLYQTPLHLRPRHSRIHTPMLHWEILQEATL